MQYQFSNSTDRTSEELVQHLSFNRILLLSNGDFSFGDFWTSRLTQLLKLNRDLTSTTPLKSRC